MTHSDLPETRVEGTSPPTTYEGAGSLPALAPTAYEAANSETSRRRRRLILPDPLAERYEYETDLSPGSQADVVLCRSREDDRQVAIKLYRGDTHIDRDAIARLEGADPDHVVPLLEVRTWEGETWEIQEYFPHGSLADFFARYGDPLPEATVEALTAELSAAVAHIHQRDIVHRDLKPANVLIRNFDPLDCVLGDFGLATELLVSRAARSVAGTMAYTAPEASYGELHKAADWWSLGVIIHEALTGRHMFTDPQTGSLLSEQKIRVNLNRGEWEIDPDVTERWDLLFQGLLTAAPEHRWGSAQVDAWLAGESPAVVVAPPPGGASRSIAPFQYSGVACRQPSDLAAEIRKDFDRAEGLLADILTAERLKSWLRQHGLGSEAEDRLGRIDNRQVLTMRLVQLQMVMDPSNPPVFRSRSLTVDSLLQACVDAESGDTGAQTWIKGLREHQILTAWSAELENGSDIAAVDERLRDWWSELTRFAAGSPTAAAQLPSCEGPLLRAALAPEVRHQIDERAKAADLTGDGLPQEWANLAKAASSDDPKCVGLKLLAMSLLPAARERAATERRAAAEALQRRQAQERRENAERAAQQRRAQRRAVADRRTGHDAGVIFWSVAACVTVLAPWLLGRYMLRDTFFRWRSSAVFDTSVRQPGHYFMTDWTMGCAAILLAAAVFLVVRPWTGRIASIVLAGVGLAAAVWLIVFSVGRWHTDETQSLKRLHTTNYPFADKYQTCGDRGFLVDGQPWRGFSAVIKGSGATDCNRLVIYHGWKLMGQFDLPQGQEFTSLRIRGVPGPTKSIYWIIRTDRLHARTFRVPFARYFHGNHW